MRHNDVIYLISATIVYDDIGNSIETNVERKVYANKMRVTTSERYAAANHNLKPSKRFEIYSFEYNDEEKIKYQDEIYYITDVDERGDKLNLTCERDIG
ncbi:hypothetical protein HMI01_10860 [Halolactibacillus miurensis]|uniref:Phage head-tail adaptor, putative, SPP1 family n=1 Tax=Halolactibacillus miurensis TaxID=306541 RepID=A0A1I6SHM2_9BACI|nr:phage head closure protein [Halolactibacillus miurensis]GEM04098.1 hypothetical protein HMI01_10860 [Halolactibacillus miurensis]SFS76414.1 phage head-tail adaptor, putative, SPP1 family [Halolactibacillus miurensis]